MAILGRNIYTLLLSLFPIIILFFLVLTDLDFSFGEKQLISFNLIYVVIYYWILKKPELLSYSLIFFAGVINDIVTGLPIGISSIDYLFLCGIASYFRNITLRPSLIIDWLAFFPTLLIINSIHYSILKVFFETDINYYYLIANTFLTLAIYPLAGIFFNIVFKLISPSKYD